MFEWLKNKLAGDELRRKDETIQHYRDLLKTYEVNREEFTRAKLKAEILEMHLEQGISLDDAINKAIATNRYSNQIYDYHRMAAQQQMHMGGLGGTGQNSMLGAGSLAGLFGSAFFQ